MQVSSFMLSIKDCSFFCLITLPCLGFQNYLLNILHSDKGRENLKDFRCLLGAKPGRWWWLLVAKSCPTLGTPWTVVCQSVLSMEFSRQEYWCGLTFPSSGDIHHPGIEPGPPALQADSLPTKLPGTYSLERIQSFPFEHPW